MADKTLVTGDIPSRMRAMQIHAIGPIAKASDPLLEVQLDTPAPGPGQLLIRVHACGVCHTEIDEIEGRTPPSQLPMTPGHQVVGTVVGQGDSCRRDLMGQRVGLAWIHHACGDCRWCKEGRENLCPDFGACGRDAHGGYAEYMVAFEDFVHAVPDGIADLEATPLLCAGAVGLRALRLCELDDGQALGLTGFGASGHLVLQMARHLFPESPVYVFARSEQEQSFARELGAAWAGGTADQPPVQPEAIIDTTPAWLPVLSALSVLAPGGRLVINAIRKEAGDLEVFEELDYDRHLWREKSLTTVANVTRRDVEECLKLGAEIPLRPSVVAYELAEANRALQEIKQGHIRGAKVLHIRRPG